MTAGSRMSSASSSRAGSGSGGSSGSIETSHSYGHSKELGKDGKPTGRTVSTKTDQDTGEVVAEKIHTHFPVE